MRRASSSGATCRNSQACQTKRSTHLGSQTDGAGSRLVWSWDVNYPAPVVDHAQARERTLARYGFLKKSGDQAGTAAEQ